MDGKINKLSWQHELKALTDQQTTQLHRIIKKIMILTVNIRVSYGKICTPCFGLFCVFCVYFFSRDLDIFPLHQSLKFPVSTEARV